MAQVCRVNLRMLVDAAGTLQRGRCMEKVKAPEYRSVHWRYCEPFANHFRMDVERDSNRVYREKFKRESDQPGEFPPTTVPGR